MASLRLTIKEASVRIQVDISTHDLMHVPLEIELQPQSKSTIT